MLWSGEVAVVFVAAAAAAVVPFLFGLVLLVLTRPQQVFLNSSCLWSVLFCRRWYTHDNSIRLLNLQNHKYHRFGSGDLLRPLVVKFFC